MSHVLKLNIAQHLKIRVVKITRTPYEVMQFQYREIISFSESK